MKKSHMFTIDGFDFKVTPHRSIASTAITGKMIQKLRKVKGLHIPSLGDIRDWQSGGDASISADLLVDIAYIVGCIMEDEDLILSLFSRTSAGKTGSTMIMLGEHDAIDEIFDQLPPMSIGRAVAEIVACNGFFPESVTSLVRAIVAGETK